MICKKTWTAERKNIRRNKQQKYLFCLDEPAAPIENQVQLDDYVARINGRGTVELVAFGNVKDDDAGAQRTKEFDYHRIELIRAQLRSHYTPVHAKCARGTNVIRREFKEAPLPLDGELALAAYLEGYEVDFMQDMSILHYPNIYCVPIDGNITVENDSEFYCYVCERTICLKNLYKHIESNAHRNKICYAESSGSVSPMGAAAEVAGAGAGRPTI